MKPKQLLLVQSTLLYSTISIILSVSAAAVISIPRRNIPHTRLYTGVFYKGGLAAFPEGKLTWAGSDRGKLIVYLDPGNLGKFNEGAEWEGDDQWMFATSEEDDEYFTLRNKRDPNSIVAMQYDKGTGYIYLALTKEPMYFEGGSRRAYALFKLVPGTLPSEGGYKEYQLKGKAFPEGVASILTETRYGEYSHYIQISVSLDDQEYYQVDGGGYKETLFTFTK